MQFGRVEILFVAVVSLCYLTPYHYVSTFMVHPFVVPWEYSIHNYMLLLVRSVQPNKCLLLQYGYVVAKVYSRSGRSRNPT